MSDSRFGFPRSQGFVDARRYQASKTWTLLALITNVSNVSRRNDEGPLSAVLRRGRKWTGLRDRHDHTLIKPLIAGWADNLGFPQNMAQRIKTNLDMRF